MAKKPSSKFNPDYAVSPGKSIQDAIDSIGWSQTELAQRMGMSHKTINEIINGKAPLTHETALLLERVIGGSVSFWNNRERIYRERLALLQEQERLMQHGEWLKSIPLKELIRRGLVQQKDSIADQVNEVLRFFAIGSVEAWKKFWTAAPGVAAFRASQAFARSPEAVATWVRAGQVAAQQLQLAPYDRARFRKVLQVIRTFCAAPPEDVWPEMVHLCADAGVALVFVREFPRTCSSGAALMLPSGNPCIILSGRHGTDDHFWFTFFHEAAHVGLHLRKEMFIDSGDKLDSENKQETEADEAARNYLIAQAEFETVARIARLSDVAICAFAARMNVAPGIVVGRLQREGYLPYSHGTKLKRKLRLEAFESAA